MKPLFAAARRSVATLATALSVAAAWAANPTTPPDPAPPPVAASLTDPATGQVWKRCVEGMAWTGKACTGEALLLTRAEAIARASAAAQAEGLGWRLPRVTELRRLAGASADRAGTDRLRFASAPAGWHWSVTVSLDTSPVNQYDYANVVRGRTNENAARLALRRGWAVDMTSGDTRGDIDRTTKLPVRLVRSPP